MTSNEIRKKYLEFFKARDHKVIPSSSLVPENDPTTLFTGSGMQPLLPYLLGEKHPLGARLVDSQKCFRSQDIEEVGDNRHTTFFEMLGNWSLGDYFKEQQLPWFFEFLTSEVGLDPKNLYITVFSGDDTLGIPKDTESTEIWKKLFAEHNIDALDAHMGSEDEGSERGMKEGERIFYYNAQKNWWSRSGVPENMPAGEPGGPDSEVFYDFGTEHDPKFGRFCHPNCDCGRFLEIGNSVFMQYIKQENGSFRELEQKNVDFGGGLERIVAAQMHNPDVFQIDIFQNLIRDLERITETSYEAHEREYRVIADHLRAAMFLISDGVMPGKEDRGYFVRRLLRRSILYLFGLNPNAKLSRFVDSIAQAYKDSYPVLSDKSPAISEVIANEESKFDIRVLERGLQWRIEKNVKDGEEPKGLELPASVVFDLVTTQGIPFELVREVASARGMTINEDHFKSKMEAHRIRSRKGAEQKFKGGLADSGEKTVMLHTATHLMLAGLRRYLGDHVHQAGSNITAERTRFDFTHPEKVDRETLDRVEAYVNEAVSKGCRVEIEQVSKDEAQKSGVEGSFWEKYPDVVNVYKVVADDGTVYSRELCGGPHVEHTSHIRGTFKILKEEASSAGVRRVKAILG